MPSPDEERARWDARYTAAGGNLFGAGPNAFLERRRPLLRPGWRTLVPADGDGRNGVWLAAQGLSVLATEASAVAQEQARARAAAQGVTLDFALGDLTAFDWQPQAWDCIVAIFIQFLPPAERDRAFAGMAAALKPGGLLLLEGYRPEQIAYGTGGPRAVENLYTRPMLEAAFADFARVEIETYDADLAEGDAHRGPSALIDLVGWR